MTTWRADVFPDSSVGEISVEVEASTFHGAERQIRTIYGDVQYIPIFVRLVCFLAVLAPVVLDGEQSLFSLVYFYSSHIGPGSYLLG